MRQVITAGQVLLGPAGELLHDGAVLIDEDIITAVGPREEIEAQAEQDVPRRDFPTHTLLPGLINCHVHLAFNPESNPLEYYENVDDTDLMLGMVGRAQQALRGGVTTLRDLGDRRGLIIRLREAIARGELAGPRILAATAPLTIPRGHCHFFGGEVSGEASIRERVRENAALGADVIKVMASGGQITPSSPPMWEMQFTEEELRIIVAEASSVGLPVAAHAHGTDAIAAAIAAGVTTVEHCTWLRPGGGYDLRDELAKQMRERGIYACVAWPPGWRDFLNRFGPDRAVEITQRLQWMRDLDVPMIPGTDGGLRGSGFDNFAGALGMYEHFGFAPERIIEMATTTSATALGLGQDVGRLAPGYSADLLVVEDDPLTGIEALTKQRLVLVRGAAVE